MQSNNTVETHLVQHKKSEYSDDYYSEAFAQNGSYTNPGFDIDAKRLYGNVFAPVIIRCPISLFARDIKY